MLAGCKQKLSGLGLNGSQHHRLLTAEALHIIPYWQALPIAGQSGGIMKQHPMWQDTCTAVERRPLKGPPGNPALLQ